MFKHLAFETHVFLQQLWDSLELLILINYMFSFTHMYTQKVQHGLNRLLEEKLPDVP